MPIRQYANARPLGRDTSDYTVSDYCDYTEDYSNINNTVSDYSVSDYSVSDYSVSANVTGLQSRQGGQHCRSAGAQAEQDPAQAQV